jgi:diguanylate cyclase (GGDEF)-like protein
MLGVIDHMLYHTIYNLALQINNVAVDWSAISSGLLGFALTVAALFGLLILTASILRFQHIISVDKHSEEVDPEEAFVIRMAGRIALLRNRPPPFALLLMEIGPQAFGDNSAAEQIDREALAAKIRALLRKGDEFSVSRSGEIAFLLETSRAGVLAVQQRLSKQLAAIAPKDAVGLPDLRFGVAHFPESGERVEAIFTAARTALARALESDQHNCWDFEPPLPPAAAVAEAEGEADPERAPPSYIDPATGLLKPSRARSTAQKFISQFRHEGDRVSIMIIRISRLDQLCREYGEGVADAVRASISADLEKNLRDDDLIACWGEDGFIVGIDGDQKSAAATARRLLGELRQKKVPFENYRVRYSVSIGTASYPVNGRLPREILESAELAQNEAEDMGRNVYAAFEPKMLKRDRNARLESAY